VNPGSLHRSLPSAAAGPAVREAGAVPGNAQIPAGQCADRPQPAEPVVVVVLADIRPASRLWGYGRFAFGRSAVRGQPGVRFAKVLGSGFEGGFGLKPSASRQGLLCLFDGPAAAYDFLERSALVQAYRDHAREYLEVRLRAFSCRGSWDGVRFEPVAQPPQDGPIAGLTRASIRPRHAREFWSKAPPAERSLADAHGCLLAVGLGEAPLLRQATFTVWDSIASMDGYARTGAHMEAIRASREGGYFSESMFVRFVPEALRGTWKGRTYA
jgi:hypothetical protein